MKYLLIFSLLFCSVNIFAQGQQKCLDKAKDFFEQNEYSYAQKTLEECLKQNQKNTDILISLGGVCMKQNNYDKALFYFKEALKTMNKQNPYTAYVYSRIADAYTYNNEYTKAANYYEAALKLEPENVNALIGKGLCEEKKGNLHSAAICFKKALEFDFTNLTARERLIALEPDILNQEELINTMKERNILDPSAQEYKEEDLDLLKKMIKAEKNNALTYMSDKYKGKVPQGLIAESYPGKTYNRKMLTYSGYKDLMFLLSQDAIDFFTSENVSKNEIFKLRDFDGNNIFDDKGFLSEQGLKAYTLTLMGQKSYLLPNEPLPAGSKKAQMIVQNLLSQGYMEITTTEYAYLIEKSRCNEKTLVEKLGVKIVNSAPGKNRFLVVDPIKKQIQQPCPFNLNTCPYELVAEKRKQKKSSSQTPVYTTTFGTGTKKPYLCKEDGTLDMLSLK